MEKGYIGVATKSALSVAHCASKKKKKKKKKKKNSHHDTLTSVCSVRASSNPLLRAYKGI